MDTNECFNIDIIDECLSKSLIKIGEDLDGKEATKSIEVNCQEEDRVIHEELEKDMYTKKTPIEEPPKLELK